VNDYSLITWQRSTRTGVRPELARYRISAISRRDRPAQKIARGARN